MALKLNFRIWNMNFWRNPKYGRAKNPEEIEKWISESTKILQKEKDVNFFVLQEASFKLYKPNFGYNNEGIIGHYRKNTIGEIIYHETPNKGSRWGLILDSNITRPEDTIFFGYNELSLISYNFKLVDNKITIINLYANNQGSSQYPFYDWDKMFDILSKIIEQNNDHLIILGGDFNASDEFPHNGQLESIRIFEYINKLNLINCTKEIPLKDRSTMIDPNYNNGYGFQNDYIFINKCYEKNERMINIYKDESISKNNDLYDHYPLDFSIIL